MATSKKTSPPKKDETITEKIGHVISDATETVVETFNRIVHPSARKAAQKHRSGPRKTAAAKAASVEKEEKALKKAAKKTASKKTAKK
jgi:hypothetical protein